MRNEMIVDENPILQIGWSSGSRNIEEIGKMVGIEREIIWKGNVKPSSPTPQNAKNYRLPMLDQLTPSMLVPITLYFQSNTSGDRDSFISHKADTLKRSLSLILSQFYPLAGRVSGDGHSIDCNDEGVPFVVARFRGCNLSDHVLQNPDPIFLRRLMPCVFDNWGCGHDNGVPDSAVALIQANFFDCGGVAVAMIFWHKAVDGVAMLTFVRSWAATARGSTTEAFCPNFISQSLFSHKEELLQLQRSSLSQLELLKVGNAVMRRYVFDAAAVSKLKVDCGGAGGTRSEVVSALIWKCFMVASLANNKTFSVLDTVINLRTRARPPFSSECFGNWLGNAAVVSTNESGADLGVLARKIRDSLGKVDGEYVGRMRGDGGLAGYQENMRRGWSKVPAAGADILHISSLCGVGFYGVDFGWGKPTWFTAPFDSKMSIVNVVWLMEGRNGDGVDAWVILDKEYMNVFDQVTELRAFTTQNIIQSKL